MSIEKEAQLELFDSPGFIKLSVSKAKTFSDCRAKFNYSYNLKLPKKQRDYHIFGQFIHKALEEFHKILLEGSQEPFNNIMTKAFAVAIEEFNSRITKEQKAEARGMLVKYLEILNNEKQKNILPEFLSVEKSFSLQVIDQGNTVNLNGFIDRVQRDIDGILHVCDYKTTKNKSFLKNDFFQLLTYAYVLYLEDPSVTKIRGSYILLRHDFEYITKEFYVSDILKIKDKYSEYAKNILEEKLWRTKPTPLCDYCDFLDICDDGKSFITKRKGFGEQPW